jgi:hypothetical protein
MKAIILAAGKGKEDVVIHGGFAKMSCALNGSTVLEGLSLCQVLAGGLPSQYKAVLSHAMDRTH